MSRITITIDIPDNATVNVGNPGTGLAEPPWPASESGGGSTPASGSDMGSCPKHHVPFEHKSGVSKTTKQPYDFWGCPVKDDEGFCKERPRT